MPGAVRALTDLGVTLAGMPFLGIRYLDRRRSATAFFTGGNGLGVRRTLLHDAMTQRARNLGVAVRAVDGHRCRAGRRLRNGRRHAGEIPGRSRRAALPDATAGPAGVPAARGAAVGSATTLPDRALDPHGRGALGSPVGGLRHARRTGRGRGGHPQFRAEAVHPAIAGFPASGRPAGRSATARFRPWRRAPCANARADGSAVGSCWSGTPPATWTHSPGRASAVSLACARSLVDAVQRDQPAAYERAWLRDTRRYRWITQTLLRARRLAVDAIVPTAGVFPDVFQAAVGQLAR